jgi:hypothetical protein
VRLTEAFVASQMNLRAAVQQRIRDGVNAEGDLARVDSTSPIPRTGWPGSAICAPMPRRGSPL